MTWPVISGMKIPKPRWIFIRGLVRESAHWEDFPKRFAQAIPTGGVFLADLPGNGRHWRHPSPTSIPAMTEFVRTDAINAPDGAIEPCYLLAISLGGMVALDWLHRHPAEIAGVVLVNTSLRNLSPLSQRLSWRAWPKLFRLTVERDVYARERAILALTCRLVEATPARLNARVEAYQQHPISKPNLIRQLAAAARFAPPSQKPGKPVLLLNSLGDQLVSPGCSAAIAQAWGLGLSTHPQAGHDLPLDDSDWVIAEVRQWLDFQ